MMKPPPSQSVWMTPGQYRHAGDNLEISHTDAVTPLGTMLIGATLRGICFLQFGDSARALLDLLHREFPKAVIRPMPDGQRGQFDRWMRALAAYLRGQTGAIDLPLDIRGTAFQIKVWKFLQTIPIGEVRTYTEVANGIGKPKAVRAVAGACARNSAALVIPCHRVIRGDGSLSGYRCGPHRKRALLELEKSVGKQNAKSK